MTLEKLKSIQSFLSSEEGSTFLNYLPAPPNPRGVQFAFDYTNIISFFYQSFISNAYRKLVGDEPLLVFEVDLHSAQLGNRLGNFFEAWAFARKHGLHFVAFALHNKTKTTTAEREGGFLKLSHPFVQALPTVELHSAPASSRDEVVKMLNTTEKGYNFMRPWPWIHAKAEVCWAETEYVKRAGKVLRRAIEAELEQSYKLGPAEDEAARERALSAITVPADSFHVPRVHHTMAAAAAAAAGLPHASHAALATKHRRLIPDAVILFRCTDMLLKGGDEYGLLSFHTYTSLIPASVKDIYIIGEPLHYCPPGSSTCCAEVCFNVTRAITDFLAPRYPNTTILVRRGFAFDGFAQLALAKTVVCSPSSFCFFAGIANPHGGANYASTPLILNGETPDLGVGLKWIDNRFVYGFWRQEFYKVRIGPSLLLSLLSLFLSHSALHFTAPRNPQRTQVNEPGAVDFIVSKLTNASAPGGRKDIYRRRNSRVAN